MNTILIRPSATLAEDWMILIFLFSLATLAYTRRMYPLRISRLWNSMWNVRILRQAIREEPNTPRANLLFNISFYLLTSLVLYLSLVLTDNQPFGLQGILLYVLLLGCVVSAYAIKLIGIRLVKIMGDGDFGLTEYEYNVLLMNRGIGIFLLPVAALIAYLPKNTLYPFIAIASFLFIAFVIYRMVRGLLNASTLGVPIFYIFFYICTLEILPLFVCIKALSH